MRGSLVVSTCVVIASAVLTAACGGGECSTGTVRYGNTCVAVDPFDSTAPKITIDPPLHTREVGVVRLTTDEPATIYYTIDGSPPTIDSKNEPDQIVIGNVPDNAQLRVFAIDLAGNQSNEENRIWIIDRDGPAAPLDFRLALSGSTRTVTWTAPPDPRLGGVMVARVEGQLASPPVAGDSYAVGDVLSPGVTIVDVVTTGGTAMFTEDLPTRPGLVRYVAWAFDDLLNYGAPAGDYQMVAVPPQSGRIEIDAAAGTVSTVTAPSHLTLSGTAALAGTTLTVQLALRNDTTRVMFAPKLLLSSALTGVVWSDSSGTFETKPYKAYGAAIMPGTSATATWTFTGASSATQLTLDLDFRDGRVMTASNWDQTTAGSIVDFATGAAVQELAPPPTGQGGDGMARGGGITPDGRLLVGARTAGVVSSFDLVTGQRLLSATLRPQKSHVPVLILDHSGSAAYAIVSEGHPNNVYDSGGSEGTLVRLDAATLVESGRLVLGIGRNRHMSISPDGKTLLISTGLTTQGVIVIDLPTFSIKQRILPEFRPNSALFTPDGTTIVVVGEQVALYKDGMRTALYPTPGTNGKVLGAALGDPGILWIGRRGEIANINLETGVSNLFTLKPSRMLEVYDGKVYIGYQATMTRLDFAGTIETTLPGFTNLDGHWIGRSPF